jgi:hypothetical protein
VRIALTVHRGKRLATYKVAVCLSSTKRPNLSPMGEADVVVDRLMQSSPQPRVLRLLGARIEIVPVAWKTPPSTAAAVPERVEWADV